MKPATSEKIVIGGAFPSEPKPNTCFQCGKMEVVKTEQPFIGQMLFGFCEEHKESGMAYGYDPETGYNAIYAVDKQGNKIKRL